MSTYAKLWVVNALFIVWIAAISFGHVRELVWGFPVLVAVSLLWPRCLGCRLPVFWNKRRDAPDHFIHYIGNFPYSRMTCGRCGTDLTAG